MSGHNATVKVRIDRGLVHTYLHFYGKTHSGDTFAFGGTITLSNAEADVLIADFKRNRHVVVEVTS